MVSTSSQYQRKLRGWLSYAFASEVFVIVSLTLFLPICLEQFARDNGYLWPEKTEPCISKAISNSTAPPTSPTIPAGRCVVKLGWGWIDTASFSLYVYSISVALQALTVISMGGIADHPPHRKRLLLYFAFLGAVSATLFLLLPSSSSLWFLSAPLSIFANVGFGASVVAMNAYLPSLAKESPEVQTILDEIDAKQDSSAAAVPVSALRESTDAETENASSPLLPPSSTSNLPPSSSAELQSLTAKYNTELSRITSRISSLGIASGYGAGIFLLIVALIPVTILKGSTFALRLAIGLSGIWWALFTIPAAIWLPSAESAAVKRVPGARPAVDEAGWEIDEEERIQREWNTWTEIKAAWKRLGNMLRWTEIKRLRNTFKYLAAWFLLSDGFTTITSTALLFGKTTLHMTASQLILIGILTPSSGIIGSLAWPILQRRLGWSNLKILIVLVMMVSIIPAYGCLGFLPIFRSPNVNVADVPVEAQKARFGGLTTPGEMYALAVFFGSVYGAFQGYARAFYAELLPVGEEARWYGLFSITDKSSSFLGPLIVGLIADTTGNIRYAFFFLVFMIWIAVPILGWVDVEKGREDARGYVYRSDR